jgi:alpha-methylacyl-CoA racemase
MPPTGALQGLRVIEFAGLGPVPFCAMMLADHGAEVIRIERPGAAFDAHDPIQRNRRSLALDVKSPRGLDIALALLDKADVVLEGFRPGVMERLGLGPELCLKRNEKLVYGRLSGWGRTGPLVDAPGRDIIYLALSGALAALGPAIEPPSPPLNLVGDYGGGAMFLVSGVLMALFARQRSGRGQVVDASILGGATALTAWVSGQRQAGKWIDERESNLLDGGAPFYRTYACKDGGWIAVGAIDPQGCREFLDGLGVAPEDPLRSMMRERAAWPAARGRIAQRIAQKTRAEWEAVFAGTQACVAPVLTFDEAARHPQQLGTGHLLAVDGVIQPGPAPHFSQTPPPPASPPPPPGRDSAAVLRELGLNSEAISELARLGVIA